MFRPNRLKARIRAGEKSFGTWLQSASPTFAEMAAIAGFDFFIVDQEHGPGDLQAAIDQMRAGACTDATMVVRVPSHDPVYLRRLVDAGVEAVLVPMVDTAEQARAIVAACRFPPRGTRGNAADITRSSSYGFVADYLDRADDNLLIIVQIETTTRPALHDVTQPRLRAHARRAVLGLGQAMTMPTRPSHAPRRHAHDQGVVGQVLGHDGTGRNEGVTADRHSAHDGRVGADGRPAPHQGGLVEVSTHDRRARVGDVREDAGRT